MSDDPSRLNTALRPERIMQEIAIASRLLACSATTAASCRSTAAPGSG